MAALVNKVVEGGIVLKSLESRGDEAIRLAAIATAGGEVAGSAGNSKEPAGHQQ